MKMPVSSSPRDQGNVLLVTLMITAVLGVILTSFLILTQSEHVSVARAQTWNAAIVVGEAGAEDGLQMINRNVGTVTSAEELTTWTNFAAADGYDVNGRVYHVQRHIADGYYDVWITNQALPLGPSVYATGTVPWTYAYASLPRSFFGAIAPVGGSNPGALARNVDIKTKYDPLWDVAMAAVLTVDMHGYRITTDSFDSNDPNYSDFDYGLGYGFYPFGELDKTKANGDVVSNTNIIDSVDVGNAKIKGTVRTGPGPDTCEISANGSVGDRPWVEGGSKGIEPDHLKTDFNVVFDTVQMPTSPLWLPPGLTDQNQTIDGKTWGWALLHDGDYVLPGLTKSLYIGTNAHVRLKITGNVSLTGSDDEIRLSPVGSRIEIYMTGTSFSVGGNGVNNETRNSLNFLYYGLPSNTYVNYGGNGNFVGAIYAPQADFYLGGGGSDTFDFIGASVTRTVQMNGHFNFHYDEALRVKGPGRGFIPTNWAEK